MVGLVEKAESMSPRVDNWGCMIVGKLGMTAKLQGRAGSGTAMVGLVEEAESMSPRVDSWGYDRWKAR